MSLFDVDITNHDRGTPSPNTHDVLLDPASKTKNTISTSYTIGNSLNAYRIQMLNNKIVLVDSSNNNIGLFGPDSTGSPVLKIAKSGFSADTASNANLIFNSNQDVLKIVETGTATIAPAAVSAGSTSITTSDNIFNNTYTTIPIVLGILTFSGNTTSLWGGGVLPMSALKYNVPSSGSNIVIVVGGLQSQTVTLTDVKFTLGILNGDTVTYNSPTYTIKYYVLQESAT